MIAQFPESDLITLLYSAKDAILTLEEEWAHRDSLATDVEITTDENARGKRS